MAEAAATLPMPSRRATVLAMVLGVLTGVALWPRLHLGLCGPTLEESGGLYVARLLRDHVPWNTYNYAPSSHIPWHLLGLGDAAGGLLGARVVAALLGAGALAFTYAATKTLFGSKRIAGWSALLLALQAPLISASRTASGDVVALFFFTGAMWLFLEGMNRRNVGWLLCMLGSVSFSIAVLSTYAVLALAPVVLLIVAARRRWLIFPTVLPSAVLLADYAHRHWADLQVLICNQLARISSLPPSRGSIAWEVATLIGPLLALALAGLVMQVARTGAQWRALRPHAFLLLLALPLPALHLLVNDGSALARHLLYPLLALAPLAAWFLQRLGRRGLVLPLALTVLLGGLGAWQSGELAQAYPDLRPVVDYLRPRIGPTTTALSEDGFVLRYAFPEVAGRNFAELTYFDNDLDGKRTPQDVVDGVWDGKVDYVLTTGKIAPELVEKLRGGVLPHRYRKVLGRPYRGGEVQLWKRAGVYKAPG